MIKEDITKKIINDYSEESQNWKFANDVLYDLCKGHIRHDDKQIIVANKMDMEESKENLKRFKEKYPDLEIYETSTLLHEGLDKVLYAIMDAIEEVKVNTPEEETSDEVVIYRYEPKKKDYAIINLGNHKWKVQSDKIDRLVSQVDFNKEEDTYQFAMTLKKMGIDAALYEAGVQVGDEVIIGTYIMNYEE